MKRVLICIYTYMIYWSKDNPLIKDNKTANKGKKYISTRQIDSSNTVFYFITLRIKNINLYKTIFKNLLKLNVSGEILSLYQ